MTDENMKYFRGEVRLTDPQDSSSLSEVMFTVPVKAISTDDAVIKLIDMVSENLPKGSNAHYTATQVSADEIIRAFSRRVSTFTFTVADFGGGLSASLVEGS